MYPDGFAEKMRRLLGSADYAAFAAAAERPRAAGLRLNTLKPGGDAAGFITEQVPWCETGYYTVPGTRPGLHPHHDAGAWYLQEPSAMAPAELLAPEPGMRVLDLCAAPGGKATRLAELLAGQGLLVANEIQPARAKILSRNLERLAVPNALCLNHDPRDLEERFAGWFDRVLVDAPCSGEGMFRREEAAVTAWSQETVQMCARRQLEILRSAARMTAPGGRLLYSTCTFSPEENEGVLTAFLAEHPDFSVVPVTLPGAAPGRPDWIPGAPAALAGACRLWPHLVRGEGHFACLLQRDGLPADRPAAEPEAEPLPPALEDFRQQTAAALPPGRLLRTGDTLQLVPADLPDLQGLRVLRAGLELGQLRRGRLQPAHAWALWLREAARTADYPADAPEIARWLRGETLPAQGSGWTLVRAGGLSLGWGKAADGILKNHYPKGLRRG